MLRHYLYAAIPDFKRAFPLASDFRKRTAPQVEGQATVVARASEVRRAREVVSGGRDVVLSEAALR